MGFLNGLLGNYSEQTPDSLKKEYSVYLSANEQILLGFKLIRDVMIITDRRILLLDKQGATGQKMRVISIYLFSIVDVTAETAGFGLDDSEITITYMTNAFLATHNPTYATKKFEFPKKYNISNLYIMLEDLAYSNRLNINGMQNQKLDA